MANGSKIPVSVSSQLKKDAQGEEYIITMVRDDSQRQKRELLLRESEAQLRQAQKMESIGMNLITNAYHALENGGGTISVSLKQKEIKPQESTGINKVPGAYAVFSVSDTGHGMPQELIDKIFGPYFTTKDQEKRTGLGLAVVYGLVKKHGGGH